MKCTCGKKKSCSKDCSNRGKKKVKAYGKTVKVSAKGKKTSKKAY